MKLTIDVVGIREEVERRLAGTNASAKLVDDICQDIQSHLDAEHVEVELGQVDDWIDSRIGPSLTGGV